MMFCGIDTAETRKLKQRIHRKNAATAFVEKNEQNHINVVDENNSSESSEEDLHSD
jgi:hypothetical protein